MPLLQVQDDNSWQANHSTRRRVLYEQGVRYDFVETHPSVSPESLLERLAWT